MASKAATSTLSPEIATVDARRRRPSSSSARFPLSGSRLRSRRSVVPRKRWPRSSDDGGAPGGPCGCGPPRGTPRSPGAAPEGPVRLAHGQATAGQCGRRGRDRLGGGRPQDAAGARVEAARTLAGDEHEVLAGEGREIPLDAAFDPPARGPGLGAEARERAVEAAREQASARAEITRRAEPSAFQRTTPVSRVESADDPVARGHEHAPLRRRRERLRSGRRRRVVQSVAIGNSPGWRVGRRFRRRPRGAGRERSARAFLKSSRLYHRAPEVQGPCGSEAEAIIRSFLGGRPPDAERHDRSSSTSARSTPSSSRAAFASSRSTPRSFLPAPKPRRCAPETPRASCSPAGPTACSTRARRAATLACSSWACPWSGSATACSS